MEDFNQRTSSKKNNMNKVSYTDSFISFLSEKKNMIVSC